MGVLRDLVRLPDVRRTEVAWALSVLGWTTTTVAILVFAYVEGGTPLVAVYSVGRALSGTAGSMLVSSLADRMPRERLLLLTTGGRTLLTGAGAWLAMPGGPAAAVVALVLVADGLAATFRPLQAAALPWLVQTPAQLATANVAATLMENTGSLIGPAVAGLTLAVADAPMALAAAVVFPLLASLALVRLRLPEEARSEPTGSLRVVRDLTSGVSPAEPSWSVWSPWRTTSSASADRRWAP